MKKFMKKSVTIILACIMAFSAVTCFAADGKQYYDYGTYVLLGDSVASPKERRRSFFLILFTLIRNLSVSRIPTAHMLPMSLG